MAFTILGISGSLRKDSFNTAALRAASELASAMDSDVTIKIADLSDIPLYDQDLRDKQVPQSVEQLTQAIQAADAILFATPEYNYSIPGVLKNAIDWVSRQSPQPFTGKPAAVMSARMSMLGGARAQYDLRRIMVFMDVHFINKPEVMIAKAHERFDSDGHLTDEATREHIAKLLTALEVWANKLGVTGHE